MTAKYTKVLDQSQQLSEVKVDEDNATNTKQKHNNNNKTQNKMVSFAAHVCVWTNEKMRNGKLRNLAVKLRP